MINLTIGRETGDKGFKPASSTDNIRHDTITIYEWSVHCTFVQKLANESHIIVISTHHNSLYLFRRHFSVKLSKLF